MGGMGLIFTPVLVRRLLCPLGLSGPMTIALPGLIDTSNSPIGRYNPPLAVRSPLIHAIHDITVFVKRLKIQQC